MLEGILLTVVRDGSSVIVTIKDTEGEYRLMIMLEGILLTVVRDGSSVIVTHCPSTAIGTARIHYTIPAFVWILTFQSSTLIWIPTAFCYSRYYPFIY